MVQFRNTAAFFCNFVFVSFQGVSDLVPGHNGNVLRWSASPLKGISKTFPGSTRVLLRYNYYASLSETIPIVEIFERVFYVTNIIVYPRHCRQQG